MINATGDTSVPRERVPEAGTDSSEWHGGNRGSRKHPDDLKRQSPRSFGTSLLPRTSDHATLPWSHWRKSTKRICSSGCR